MVGKKPLKLPSGVTVKLEPMGTWTLATFTGPKGEIAVRLPAGVEVEQEEQDLKFSAKQDVPSRILGLGFALSRNASQGVSEGFQVKLEMMGVGYRAAKTGEGLKLS